MEQKTIPIPAERIPLLHEVEYRKNYARQNVQGVLKNISITGAFLECGGHDLLPTEKIILYFSVSGRNRRIHASIVWTRQNGAGIKFHPFNNRDVQIVDDLMYFVNSKRRARRVVLDNIFKKVG